MLRYAAELWGYAVKLLEIEAATDKTLKTYEAAAAEQVRSDAVLSGTAAEPSSRA